MSAPPLIDALIKRVNQARQSSASIKRVNQAGSAIALVKQPPKHAPPTCTPVKPRMFNACMRLS
jgi:hypothetical protein